jgi:hypothetical protein
MVVVPVLLYPMQKTFGRVRMRKRVRSLLMIFMFSGVPLAPF